MMKRSNSPKLRVCNKDNNNSSHGLILIVWIGWSTARSALRAESSNIKTLTSRNYPLDYDSNTDWSWTILTSQHSGYIVELTFDDFRLESENMDGCQNDYLAVYDGGSRYSSQIGKFCGFMDTSTKVYSTGRELTLRFVTDNSLNYRGFKLSYFAVPAATHKQKCFLGNVNNNNLQLEGSSGTFESPRYPLKYPKSMSCTWVITVPDGKLVKLSFDTFDVEWSSGCDEDYVQVYDGKYSSSKVKNKLCGTSHPGDVYSTGRYMRVHFRSDKDNYGNYGFKAQFEEANRNNVVIIAVAVGAAVVFLLFIVMACVVLRCRNAKRTANSRQQGPLTSAPPSAALTPIQNSYPAPPQVHYHPYTAAGNPHALSTGNYHAYPIQPPPPYPYPAESPPPYPGEERSAQYSPPERSYLWPQNRQGNGSQSSAENHNQ